MSKRFWAFGSALAVAVAVVPVSHAFAGTTQTESGCYDITGQTSATFKNVIKSVTQTGDGSVLSPYGAATTTSFADAGAAETFMVLSAPSCTAATYTVLVYPDGVDPAHSKPIRTISQAGDGTTGDSRSNPLDIVGLFDHLAANCVQLVTQVSDGRTVIDTAPDTGAVQKCKDGSGGAQGFGG